MSDVKCTKCFFSLIISTIRSEACETFIEAYLFNSAESYSNKLKGALSGLRQFSATEIPLKMMKNVFILPKKFFSFSRYLSIGLEFLVI